MDMIEKVCEGLGVYVVCKSVDGIRLNANEVILPSQYQGWIVEKAVYSPEDDKIYVQIVYKNVRKIITL
jgi:hypothetical protein